MSTHTYENLPRTLIVFGALFAFGVFVPFIIAVSGGRVSPFVPYISDCGGNFPESGIFSACLTLSAMLGQIIMILRYLVVEAQSSNDRNDISMFLNKTSIILGSISSIGFILVASFPATSITYVHNTAAGTSAMCIILYMFCQTWISRKLAEEKSSTKLRISILSISAIAIVITAVFGVLGSINWSGEHSVAVKRPEDKGFVFYVISASAEWVLSVLYFFFFVTFLPEFRDSTFQFRLRYSKKPQMRVGVTVIGT